MLDQLLNQVNLALPDGSTSTYQPLAPFSSQPFTTLDGKTALFASLGNPPTGTLLTPPVQEKPTSFVNASGVVLQGSFPNAAIDAQTTDSQWNVPAPTAPYIDADIRSLPCTDMSYTRKLYGRAWDSGSGFWGTAYNVGYTILFSQRSDQCNREVSAAVATAEQNQDEALGICNNQTVNGGIFAGAACLYAASKGDTPEQQRAAGQVFASLTNAAMALASVGWARGSSDLTPLVPSRGATPTLTGSWNHLDNDYSPENFFSNMTPRFTVDYNNGFNRTPYVTDPFWPPSQYETQELSDSLRLNVIRPAQTGDASFIGPIRPAQPGDSDFVGPIKTGFSSEELVYYRARTPTQAIRNMVNPDGPKIDPVYGYTVNRLEADHTVPYDEIMKMPGMVELPKSDILDIINLKDNFVGLGKSTNSSKGANSWADWVGHSELGPVPDEVRSIMLQRETESRAALQRAILERGQNNGN